MGGGGRGECRVMLWEVGMRKSLLSLHHTPHTRTTHTHTHTHTHRLLSHVFDPELDANAPREYIVYACPLGVLGSQVDDFTEKTLLTYGRNAAHKSFPHLTLCQFFQVQKWWGEEVVCEGEC